MLYSTSHEASENLGFIMKFKSRSYLNVKGHTQINKKSVHKRKQNFCKRKEKSLDSCFQYRYLKFKVKNKVLFGEKTEINFTDKIWIIFLLLLLKIKAICTVKEGCRRNWRNWSPLSAYYKTWIEAQCDYGNVRYIFNL